ncbi:MAG: sigma-54-dependent Fis family transcriptional regulator [Melioribacteraceae bacterium]
MDTKIKNQQLNKSLGEFISQLSQGFVELSGKVKETPELGKDIDRLFRKIMDFNRGISTSIKELIDQCEKVELEFGKLRDEKNRLERLYASGIQFQSETDMRRLMESAIETVVKELDADEGFIVLMNDMKQIEKIVAKNLDPENDPTAKELSTSIITETIEKSEPLKIDDINTHPDLVNKLSVISLKLSSALSVPLISNNKILGVVYIDRRNRNIPFKESDLAFLISFARQIVRGMEVSLEINYLEKKLQEKSCIDFMELRSQFKYDNIIGSSRKLYEILKLSAKVAESDASVLLLGENGTGKDLLAQAIHENSPRRDKPFVAVNCGAIPSDLLESELFGYETGAFTGAIKSKPGRLETADGGTIFLDEIGEMSINLQAKLLRVIQTREIERLGGITSKKINVRFIAATNKDLSAMIADKLFREDLYYRLKVIEIKLPSLRERKDDIEELAKFFLSKHSEIGSGYTISDEALDVLEQYPFPGNIRELENIIQRSVILSKSNEITIEDLPPEIVDLKEDTVTTSLEKTLSEAEEEFRKLYIGKILKKVKSKSDAAKILGINRSHLHKLLSQLDIDG